MDLQISILLYIVIRKLHLFLLHRQVQEFELECENKKTEGEKKERWAKKKRGEKGKRKGGQ
mgnify:CR=1 FL=1